MISQIMLLFYRLESAVGGVGREQLFWLLHGIELCRMLSQQVERLCVFQGS